MTLPTSRVHAVLSHPAVTFIASLCTIAAFIWAIFEKFYARPPEGSLAASEYWEVLILAIFALPLVALAIYSIRVRQENRAFRLLMEKLHKINHDYRDILCQTFGGKENPKEPHPGRAKQELQALSSVCQTASKIFNSFTHSDCMVTIKLITKKNDGTAIATTHLRSESICQRDNYEPKEFVINRGQNTAFDKAIQVIPGRVSRFYSPDLEKEKNYRNQRDDWHRFYRSTIVVPIRYVDPTKRGRSDASDDIGFLSVDTMSVNRLNDGFHLQYLAALADQMYNFMSLMRGKFSIEAGRP